MLFYKENGSEEPIEFTNEDNLILAELIQEGVDEKVLSEGMIGGLISLVKRWYTGKDDTMEKQVQNALKKIKTEDDRKKLITELQQVKKTSKEMTSDTSLIVRIVFLGDWLASIWSLINKNDGSVEDFYKVIDRLIVVVKKHKVSKK